MRILLAKSRPITVAFFLALEAIGAVAAFFPQLSFGQGCPNMGSICKTGPCPIPCTRTLNTCVGAAGSTFHCADGFDCGYGSYKITKQFNGDFCNDSANIMDSCTPMFDAAQCLTYTYYSDGACTAAAQCGSVSCDEEDLIVDTYVMECFVNNNGT